MREMLQRPTSRILLSGVLNGVILLLSSPQVQGDGIPQGTGTESGNMLDVLRQRVTEEPDNYAAHLELAAFLHRLDATQPDGGTRVPEAETAYRKAVALAPNVAAESGILLNLAALFMSAGRLEDALAATEECIRLAAQEGLQVTSLYAGAHFNKGKVLGMLGRKKDADEAYRQAAELSRDVSPSTWGKALAARKLLTDEEVSELETALRYLELLHGREAAGVAPAAATTKRRQRRGNSGELEELKVDWAWLNDASDIDRSWMHFALFSTLDLQGHTQRAWHHLEAANKLQRAHVSYNASQELVIVDTLRAVFAAPEWLRASGEVDAGTMQTLQHLLGGKAGFQDPSPIFVVGMPRSGSTLVEQILASHPQVYGAGEDTAFAPLIPDILGALEGTDWRRLEAIGRTYVEQMRRRVPGSGNVTHIVDKMLRNAWNIGYIMVVLPKSCLIHVMRHPLDVALSCYAQPFEGSTLPWAWNLTEIAVQIESTHEVMLHWDVLFPGKILRVPYERLVADQEGVTRQILKHCGLPWDPAVLDFHTSTRPVQTASLGQVRQQIYSSAVGKWKTYEKELKDVQKSLAHLIEEYEAEAGLSDAHDEL